MKIIDFALILAILFTTVLAGIFLEQVTPARAMPVLGTIGNQPDQPGDTVSSADPNHVQTVSLPNTPVVQVVVGLVVIVFGAIACFPLFVDTDLER